MKGSKIILTLLVAVLLFGGCANKADRIGSAQSSISESQPVAGEPESTENTQPAVSKAENSETESESRTLIAYFSRYGNIDTENEVDIIASASVLVKDSEMMGNMEYVAKLVQENVRGDMHFIEVAEKYPSDYDETDNNELDVFTKEEYLQGARPALATQVENMAEYDTVFLCFPNWYSDMPVAVYSFLEEYDLSGKTVVVFTSSGGGGRSGSISSIQELEPDAIVIEKEFATSHSSVESLTAQDIHDWLQEIGYLQ